jgi:hypothetical protein
MGLAEEKRWYQFQTARSKRALEWLEKNNLEAVGND